MLLTVPLLLGSTCNPPPVVNRPSGDLDAKFIVIDTTANPTTGDLVAAVQFSLNGKIAQLSSSSSVTCNGVNLKWNGLIGSHAERVALQPVGGAYVFQHTRSGVIRTVSLTVPPRPAFSSPTVNGATLTRSSGFEIHYSPGGGASIRGRARDAASGSVEDTQSDDGTLALNVSGLSSGAGSLVLVRKLESTLPPAGFNSARSEYSTGSEIDLTWQ